MNHRSIKIALLALCCTSQMWAASSQTTITQTVNKRGTQTELTGSPLTGVVVGNTVTFTGLLDTAGAPVVTTETISIKDGTTVLGTAPITSVSATNLLPYSQDFSKWTSVATGVAAPTETVTGTAPDGTTTATQLVFPATTSTAYSGLTYPLPGTNYAGQNLTASVWVYSATGGTITLQITDSPKVAGAGQGTCPVSAGWTRCELTYAMPAGAGTGAAFSIVSNNAPAQTISIWGAQLETAAKAGPLVQTVGTSATGTGGAFTYSTSTLLDGNHSISAAYPGDTNFIGSSSTPFTLTVGKGAASITLAQSAATTVYGIPVTFTATLTGPVDTPTGTVTFMDGATPIGTGTIASGVATFTTSALVVGSHPITAVYSGDAEFNPVTSSVVTHVVTQVAAVVTVTSSLNPDIYGDTITFTVNVAGVGVVPTGAVTLTDGATELGRITLNPAGVATLTVNNFTAGSHTITVVYGGDANYF